MASLWKHPASPFWVACFTVYTPNGPERWKRSLKIEDRKLARKIADVLDDGGRGAMTAEEITSFDEKIRDTRARRAIEQILAEIFVAVTGRKIGAGSMRAFGELWLEGIRGEMALQSFFVTGKPRMNSSRSSALRRTVT